MSLSSKNINAVFILGENRNGTTWLGNTLYLNFDIVVPFHELHFGLIETSLFSLNQIWNNFKTLEEKKNFISDFSKSDLFISLDGDLEIFNEKNFDSFYDFFFDLIENKCRLENVDSFAIKLEPRFISNQNELDKFIKLSEKRFKKISFITIQRDFERFFKSSKLLLSKTTTKNKIHKVGFLSTLIVTAKYKHFYKNVYKSLSNKNTLHLDFEKFKSDFDQSLQTIGETIGKEIQPRKIEDIIRNTSIKDNTFKVGLLDRLCILFVMKIPFLDKLIIRFLDLVIAIFGNKTKHTYFRIHRSIHSKDELIEEFKNSYEEILIRKLKQNSK